MGRVPVCLELDMLGFRCSHKEELIKNFECIEFRIKPNFRIRFNFSMKPTCNFKIRFDFGCKPNFRIGFDFNVKPVLERGLSIQLYSRQ